MENERREYNLSEMTEDEKDELIKELAYEVNSTSAARGALHNAIVDFAFDLNENNKFGSRKHTIDSVSARMMIVAQVSLLMQGVDIGERKEQAEVDQAFEDLARRLGEGHDGP